jgi:hypothetical protein
MTIDRGEPESRPDAVNPELLADDLPDDGGGVATAQDEVSQQVGQRVALGPLEVAVRPYAGGVARVSRIAAIAFGAAGLLARRIR